MCVPKRIQKMAKAKLKKQKKQEMHIVARNIRYICREERMTYDSLADGIGIERKELERIIYGEESDIAPLSSIAKVLGVNEEDLRDEECITKRKENVHIISNMRYLRIVHGMDYADIVIKTGINYKTLYQIANGVYSFSSDKLDIIAHAFGLTKDELLYSDLKAGKEERLSQNLKALRRKQKISICGLSEKSGVSLYTIEKAEQKGEINRQKVLAKIAENLGVTTEELVFGKF